MILQSYEIRLAADLLTIFLESWDGRERQLCAKLTCLVFQCVGLQMQDFHEIGISSRRNVHLDFSLLWPDLS
jgi:hypothetical protein